MIPVAVSAGTVMAVFLMAVIVLGYVAIWAIWHFFFRGAGEQVTGDPPAIGAERDARGPDQDC